MSDLIRRHLPVRREREEQVGADEVAVVTETDRMMIAYERLGLDELLDRYANGAGYEEQVTDGIEAALSQYAVAIGELAYSSEGIKVELVRSAFDRLYDGMNLASAPTMNTVPPRTLGQAALERFGIKKPQKYDYVRPLDDRYWSKQFMEQYIEERGFVSRAECQTEKEYFTRYVAGCLRGFPWAYFSYVRR